MVIETEEKLKLDASTRNSIKKTPKGHLNTYGSHYVSLAKLNHAMVKLELLELSGPQKRHASISLAPNLALLLIINHCCP